MPASRRSTFAERHFTPDDVLSSDAYRAAIAGDEADQRVTGAAFAALHRELDRRLAAGRLTVVDATNVETHARRGLLVRSRAAALPATAIVLDLTAAVVLAHNAARATRVVGEDVVLRHLERLRRTLDGRGSRLRDEGFTQVVVLRTPDEVAAVILRRQRP
ncbi:MAG: hypothetical protein A2Z32_07810 [Chloroflexi bacterium RBG_16_69_14]|nr:MAG: hypothetical protein A2Z32_07810 [Chloroflexi bacterium RBG_16_69_14]